MARTTGRALSNCHPPLVAGWELVRRHFGGVRAMSNLQVAYIVRLNGKGRGSIEYLTPEEIEEESK